MRPFVLGVAVLIGLAALASPAAADVPGDGSVHLAADGSPQAGEPVDVVVRCAGAVGAAWSPVLRIGEPVQVDVPDLTPTYVAAAVVDPVAVPGEYPLTATCGGDPVEATFRVYRSEGSVHIAADGSPQAGELIDVVVRCAGAVGAPWSPVLRIGEPVEVESPDETPVYAAPAVIDPAAAPGEHRLSAPCGGVRTTTTFTVYPGGG